MGGAFSTDAADDTAFSRASTSMRAFFDGFDFSCGARKGKGGPAETAADEEERPPPLGLYKSPHGFSICGFPPLATPAVFTTPLQLGGGIETQIDMSSPSDLAIGYDNDGDGDGGEQPKKHVFTVKSNLTLKGSEERMMVISDPEDCKLCLMVSDARFERHTIYTFEPNYVGQPSGSPSKGVAGLPKVYRHSVLTIPRRSADLGEPENGSWGVYLGPVGCDDKLTPTLTTELLNSRNCLSAGATLRARGLDGQVIARMVTARMLNEFGRPVSSLEVSAGADPLVAVCIAYSAAGFAGGGPAD